MNTTAKILIVVALIAALAVVIALKQSSTATNAGDSSQNLRDLTTASQQTPSQPNALDVQPESSANLPSLVDVGAGTCIPCKMMAPILEQLKSEYTGRLKVEFFDIRKDPDVITEYKVKIIPTQIFFDASGTERFRHEGFMSKEDILAKWKELGAELTKVK